MIANPIWDVIVVGGGPGGSAAAKRCAEHGLKTLLLERYKLPRNKVCTGMIMSVMTQTLIREEFGDFSPGALTIPPYINGLMFHSPGTKDKLIEHKMPFAWRKDLDYWMNQKVPGAGGEIWDNAQVKSVTEENGQYKVRLETEGESKEVKAKFVVGADGAASIVRESLFPDLKTRYLPCTRECYQITLDLDERYVHYFFFPALTNFDVNRKGDVLLIEGGINPKMDLSSVMSRAKEMLAKDYGFDSSIKPLWRDGCVEPLMHRELFSGAFTPAKGNVLLVGNAAGLVKPVTGEGIGMAIKSGLLAADAIIKAADTGKEAKFFYLESLRDIIATLEKMYPPPGKLREEASKGGEYLLEAYRKVYAKSFGIL